MVTYPVNVLLGPRPVGQFLLDVHIVVRVVALLRVAAPVLCLQHKAQKQNQYRAGADASGDDRPRNMVPISAWFSVMPAVRSALNGVHTAAGTASST